MQEWLGAIEDESEAILWESVAGLHERTFTSVMNPGAGVSWPALSDTVSVFDLGPEWPFPGPGDITTFPDVLGVAYGKPLPESRAMIVLPNFVGDPEPSGILPEFGDMCPGSVACPCLHTETSAGSVPRQFLTSAAGGGYVSLRRLWDSLGTHFTSAGTAGGRLIELDDMILCMQLLRLYALVPEKSVLNMCFGRDLLACLFLNGTDMGSVYCKWSVRLFA